jgi:hypothetical protein
MIVIKSCVPKFYEISFFVLLTFIALRVHSSVFLCEHGLNIGAMKYRKQCTDNNNLGSTVLYSICKNYSCIII